MRGFRTRKTTKRRVAFSLEAQRLALVAASATSEGTLSIDALGVRDLDHLHQVPELLCELAEEFELAACPAVAVLHPELYEMRMVDAPEVADHEMAAAVQWMARDLVESAPDEVTVDYLEVPDAPGRQGPRRLYVVVARNELTEGIALGAEEAGLQLEKIDIGELALRNIAARLPGEEHGLGVVRIGRRGGRLTITREGHLYLSRRIEMGLDQILAAAQAEQEAEEPHAIDLGAPESDDFETLLLEVQRSLDFYESQFAQAPIGELVFAPLEEPVPELLPYMEKHLGATVRGLDMDDVASAAHTVREAEWSRALLAVGALLGEPGAAA